MSDYSRIENASSGERILDALWRNPEGLLLLAAGAALLMRRGVSSSTHGGHNQFRPGERDGDVIRDRSTVRGIGDRVADAAQSAGDYASEVANKVSQTTSSYASSMSEYADEATDRSLRVAREARLSVQSTAQHILQEQPLAVALAGFAVGTAVAAAFPATSVEKRALGPTGQRFKDAAGRVGEHLKEAGSQAGQSLMDAAEERGFTSEGLKEVAREVGDAFSGALSGEQTQKKAAYNSSTSPPQDRDEETSGSHSQRASSSGQSHPSGQRGPR